MTMFKKVRMRSRKQAKNLWNWHHVATYYEDRRIVLCPVGKDRALEIVPAAGMDAVIIHEIDKEGLKHDGCIIETFREALLREAQFIQDYVNR